MRAQLCLILSDPMDYSCQSLLSMGFSRKEYWSGLPFPSPRDLPDPGIEPCLLCLLHWQVGILLYKKVGRKELFLNTFIFNKTQKQPSKYTI